jgi:hypothetical protein
MIAMIGFAMGMKLASIEDVFLDCIAQIESGRNDHAVGHHKEISRYQIKPSVWYHYTNSNHYSNPKIAKQVAKLHLDHLTDMLAHYEIVGHNLNPEELCLMEYRKIGAMWHFGETKFKENPAFCLASDYAIRYSNLVDSALRAKYENP